MTMNTRANRLHPRPMEKKNDGTRPRARQSEKFSNEHPKGTQTHMLLSSSPLPRTLCTLSGAILPRRFHFPPLPFRNSSSSTVVPLVLATSARFARESRPCFPLHRRPVRSLSSDERARPVSFAVFSDGCLWVTETSRGRAGTNTGRFFSCPAALGSPRAWSCRFERALFEWRIEIRNGKNQYSSL